MAPLPKMQAVSMEINQLPPVLDCLHSIPWILIPYSIFIDSSCPRESMTNPGGSLEKIYLLFSNTVWWRKGS